MSDLSLPSLALLPLGEDPPPAAPAGSPSLQPFAWPTPPYAAYPSPLPQLAPEPCEIEGPNGKVTTGRLVFFDPDAGVVHLQVPPARGTLTLRLSQFRRLTLTRPLAPLMEPPTAGTESLLGPGAVLTAHLRFRGDARAEVPTIGQVDHPMGLFLFPPHGANGPVLRSFYPRAGLTGSEIGPRIGELLVDQQCAAAADVEAVAVEQHLLRSRKLGDILVIRHVVTPEQLDEAIEQQARMPMIRIGEALVALGFVTEIQLEHALEQQSRDRSVPLGQLLVQRGIVTAEDLQTALARKMGYPIVDVDAFPVQTEAALRLPAAVARRLPALPLTLRGGRLVVALEDPSSRRLIDELEFSAQIKVLPVLARAGTLVPAVERLYQRIGDEGGPPGLELLATPAGNEFEGDNANKLLASMEQEHSEAARDDEPAIEQSDNSLVRLINSMILEAQQGGVSDIHIECPPAPEKVRIRFRRDGVMRPYLELPPSYRQALVARLKIMCDLDISERRKPQDGKINFGRFVPGQKLELRMASIPTATGLEDVVLRLLASARALPIGDMGLAPLVLERLKAAVERPYGMVLCVGPTGSGKTTTLHAALGHINTPERKIWTAEDPVEITQRGLRQVQVNPRIEWTFAKALRAFLRADPDVIMVGEIRDRETAQMAVEASLTGHLVLSTLHTNSAPETVTRLLDMGMDPFSFADSLLAVLAQRLVRRLCRQCVSARPASADETEALLHEYLHAWPDADIRPERETTLADWVRTRGKNGVLQHHAASGCERCGGSGFAGRAGLHELLIVNRELRHLIQTSARAEQLQRSAMLDGMRTLRQDGIEKVLAGITSIDEVRAISNN